VARWGRRATPPGRWGAKVAVALHLAARGAEIAPPATRVEPGPHDQDGLEITLWEFVPHDPDPELDDDELAHSLERLHGHLASWPGELPDYRERIARTGRLLVDDVAMQAVPRDGLALLRLRFAAMAPTLLERARPTTVLHGGPHAHNVLATLSGAALDRFRIVLPWPSRGRPGVSGRIGSQQAGRRPEVLWLAQQMLRISVATICWCDPDRHPRLREAAEHHLAALVEGSGLPDQT
jgi:hypothetical protein